MLLFFSLESGKPTIVHCSLIVESFGNIEEANMVCIVMYQFTVIGSLNLFLSWSIWWWWCWCDDDDEDEDDDDYFYCDLQEYRVYAYFHQHWTDKRLAGKLNRTITIKGGDIENIWVPDPYCYNARESNMMMPDEETHSNVKINSSGKITYSRGWDLNSSQLVQHFTGNAKVAGSNPVRSLKLFSSHFSSSVMATFASFILSFNCCCWTPITIEFRRNHYFRKNKGFCWLTRQPLEM